MNSRSILYILLTVMAGYFIYIYGAASFYTEKTTSGVETTHFMNPVSLIFTGRTSKDGDTYTSFGAGYQFIKLSATVMLVILFWAGTKYIRSKGKETASLRFYLVLCFMGCVATQVYAVLYVIFIRLYPGTLVAGGDTFSYSRYLMYTIPSFILVYAALWVLQRETPQDITPPIEDPLHKPVRWIRGFHHIFDRTLMMILTVNFFFIYDIFDRSTYDDVAADKVTPWMFISVEASIFLGYLLTEGLFYTSPTKVLTGMQVIKTATGGKPSFISIILRSVIRAIPFEPFTILSRSLWHDSASGTTVTYIGNNHIMTHTSKLFAWILALLLSVATWLFIDAVGALTKISNIFQSSMIFPSILILITILPIAVLFTCWIASFSNYAYNIAFNQFSEENRHFWSAAYMWMPLLNFTALTSTLNDALEDLDRAGVLADTEVRERLFLRGKQLGRAFAVFYVLLTLSVAYYIAADYSIQTHLAMTVGSAGIILWTIYAIRFVSATKAFFATLTPQTGNHPASLMESL